MKQGTINSKENKNSIDTASGNNTNSDATVDVSRKAPANGSAKVIDEHRTVTVYNKPAGKQSNHSDDEFDEEDFYDPLSFLDEREDSDAYPLSMTITRHRDLSGTLLQKEDQEYIGRFEVNRDRWRDDVKQKVSPGGGRFLVVFRWDAIGPDGQNRGSIAAKYPFFCAPSPATGLPGQSPATGIPVQSAEEMETKILQKMKLYKDLFGGSGSGGNSLTEAITLLNSLGLIKKPDEGGNKGLAEQISEIKEVVSLIGGGGTSGWDVVRDLANSEVVAAGIDGLTEIGKAYALRQQPGTPPDKPKHDAESDVLPEHELTDAKDAEAPLPTPERVEMPAAQAELYNKMIERAIQDMLTNSPVDSTAIICEQYFEKYPVDSIALVKPLLAGEEAAVEFIASHTTDAELQKNLLALPTAKEWIGKLRAKLLP
jgi:hypothetical protein